MNDRMQGRGVLTKAELGDWMRTSGSLLAAALVFSSASAALADDNLDSQNDWPMFNRDRSGSRYNPVEKTLGADTVGGLHVKWEFKTPAPVAGTPAVVGNVVYAGDMSGMFYAVKSDGTLLWKTQLQGPITASALVMGNMVIFGDLAGNLYGLQRTNGAVVWSMRPDEHPFAAIWGSPTKIGNYAAVGVASNEEGAVADPNYPCCSTRGSLVLFDPRTGGIVWQTFTITDDEQAAGASGASIWSTPSYDNARGLIYVTTGNNFSEPTTSTSDAIMAFDVDTGELVWSNQRYPDDEWNFLFPYSPDHPDADFGDSPQVYDLPGGQRVVGAGQKSGFYHVVDASTGELVSQNQVEVGGLLGGLFSDTAVANGIVYANGIDWPVPGAAPPVAGDLIAMTGDGQELWRFTTPYSPDLAGVAVANSVVYFTSSYSGSLFALDANSGAMLRQVPIGISESGPAVSRGQVYVGTGDAIAVAFVGASSPGSIVALGL